MTKAQQVMIKIQAGQIQNFFDILTDILLKISGGKLVQNKNFKKYFSSYMLCRYLSMRQSLLQYGQMFNIMQSILTPQQLYKLAYKIVPKQTNSFIKYISKKKQKSKKSEDSNILINNKNEIKNIIFDL